MAPMVFIATLSRWCRRLPVSALRRLFLGVCAFASVAPVAIVLLSSGDDVRTEDQNRDGRPDVWRLYDRQGRVIERALDTNFDGRSDVQEYYDSRRKEQVKQTAGVNTAPPLRERQRAANDR